jgi:tRNA (guanine37-N1)-methyltransferase
MHIDILSLFPEYFQGPFDVSILKKAQENQILSINHIDLREFGLGKHHKVDDRPYGGGPGMVLRPEPLAAAIRTVITDDSHVILLSPQGKLLNSAASQRLANYRHLVLICGHYEGVDERIIEAFVDEEISIGDFVLTNGGPAAVVLVEAVSRFIPGVLGHEDAAYQDSFVNGIFDAPHYTRPYEFEGMKVPDVLINGHHALIQQWREKKAYEKTKMVRPDLVNGSILQQNN